MYANKFDEKINKTIELIGEKKEIDDIQDYTQKMALGKNIFFNKKMF
jgi:hypothetical protein